MIYLTDEALHKYGDISSFSRKAHALLNQQKEAWELASDNYGALHQAISRKINFGHFCVELQFNPARIRSTGAVTDRATIEKRPCFLCEAQRPAEQAGIDYKNRYDVLCNPFPIFPGHLTIPLKNHEPQLLTPYIEDFLSLCFDLQGFLVFYNGPRCGASAPDHFHFQAGAGMKLPIENELPELIAAHSLQLIDQPGLEVYTVENILRRCICIRSNNMAFLKEFLNRCPEALATPGVTEEPMMNVLGWYKDGGWYVVLFPRAAQRPRQYFSEGAGQILVSPAAVELGGLLILPRREDFEKIEKNDVESIFGQVTLGHQNFANFKEKLIELL